MSEVQAILKEHSPADLSTERFIQLNHNTEIGNALHTSIISGNKAITADLLKSRIELEPADFLKQRISKFKGSVGECLISHGEDEISELPQILQDLIAVTGYSLNRCSSLETEHVQSLFKKLEDSHKIDIQENIHYTEKLFAEGQLAPNITNTPETH